MPDEPPSEQSGRIELADADGTVVVEKIVSKGERLAIVDGERTVKLDALLLEGLSWQRDRAAIDELLDSATAVTGDPVGPAPPVSQPTDESVGLAISSEYAHVHVRRVVTEAGHGIEIATPGRNTAITLGPQSLRGLAAVDDTYVFSVWFKTPFGPEDTPVEGPL
ncbi:hypothetical protein NDI56_17135 [Haloarcula sp. S1CR25-12]|uniref:Uncharacterized protein n=1 Tax=Haloarcula saliterrae TaxID=2950534 RepID=A0ABU2FHB0_9EURY|nr:hypothetical protein [Haloarcula sp. S1CR25-12]MDS0261126.1 hypothetical protein [Haloarcula sp. S1CR25-12]